ncbi:MAG: MBL fold metallo-hydrolase [Promethearchaeati archaeon SRVP18_Atabeyarchaeia-1]
MASIVSLGGDVHLIDSNALGIKGYCSSYVISSMGENVLIETGPSTSSLALLDGIKRKWSDLGSFTHVIVTHIHFDHAGGVGDVVDSMPNAVVAVHERGAMHIIDPSRLTESARRVFGESLSLYGEFKPVKKNKVRPVNDGDEIELRSGRKLKIIYAPGHASHEICIFDELTRSLFTGDAAGLYFEDVGEVTPTTPPPDFDLYLAIDTIDKLARLDPRRLLFSHFGAVTQVQRILSEAKRQLEFWGERILETFSGSPGSEQEKLERLSTLLEIRTKVLPTAFKREHRNNSIKGYLRYYRKKKNLQI